MEIRIIMTKNVKKKSDRKLHKYCFYAEISKIVKIGKVVKKTQI